VFANPVRLASWDATILIAFGARGNGGIGCGNEIAPKASTVKREMITIAATAHV